jgi:murein L,D-transpeptidase YcbB/YkuD
MAESGSGRVSVRFLSGFLLFLFYSIARADGATGENLRLRMEAQIDPLVINLLRGPAGQQVERFYIERAYKPAWSMGGRPTHQVDELRQVVAATFAHGLDPSDYHQEALDGFNNQLEAISATDLELLATSAYLGLANHFLSGRVDPVQLDKDWQVERKAMDLVAHLEQALADGRIGASLTELLPQQAGYWRLVEQLAGLRMQPDWPVVPAGSRLEVGSADERVVALRARLATAGLLEDNEPGQSINFPDFGINCALTPYI